MKTPTLSNYSLIHIILLLFFSGFCLNGQTVGGVAGSFHLESGAVSSTVGSDGIQANSSGGNSINIPLFELKGKDMSLPISMTYHNRGVRVADESGWVGMNWSLAAGGRISREVKNVPDDVAWEAIRNQLGGGNIPYTLGWIVDDELSNCYFLNNFPCGDNLMDWVGDVNCPEEHPLHSYNQDSYYAGDLLRIMMGQGTDHTVTDMESDIYHLEAPGLYAKFLFGHDGTPKLLDANDFSIEITPNLDYENEVENAGLISSFTVQTSSGIRYLFTDLEKTKTKIHRTYLWCQRDGDGCNNRDESYEREHISGWYLSKMENMRTLESVDFAYENNTSSQLRLPNLGRTIAKKDFLGNILPEGRPAPFFYTLNYATILEVSSPVVKNIKTKFHEANFFTSLRTDVLGSVKLDRLEIATLESSIALREFDFNYLSQEATDRPDLEEEIGNVEQHTGWDIGSVPDREFYEDAFSIRTYLSSIVESNNGTALPEHSFTYHNTADLPNKFSKEKDHWGFFNANNSNSLIPKLYVYPNAEEEYNRYRNFPMKPGVPGSSPSFILDGANRKPNAKTIYFGALKQIQSPLGGKQEYQFEPGSYLDPHAEGGVIVGGGLRIKAVATNDGNGNIKNSIFSYEDPATKKSSGILLQKPVYATEMGWSALEPDHVEDKLFNFFNREEEACINSVNEEEWGADNIWDYFTFRYGKPIQKMPSSVQYRTVTITNSGAGAIRSIFSELPSFKSAPAFVRTAKSMGQTGGAEDPLAGGASRAYDAEDVAQGTSPCSNISYGYARFEGHNVFPYGELDNSQKELSAGKLMKETILDDNNNVVSETEYSYDNVLRKNKDTGEGEVVYGINANNHNAAVHVYPATLSRPVAYSKYGYRTNIVSRLSESKTTIYGENGNSTTQSETYDYNSDNFQLSAKSVNSDCGSKRYETKYPTDFPSEYASLIEKDITGLPVASLGPDGTLNKTYFDEASLLPVKATHIYGFDTSDEEEVIQSEIIEYNGDSYPTRIKNLGVEQSIKLVWDNGLLKSEEIDNFKTSYEYYDHRKVKKITHPDGIVDFFEYDGLHRVILTKSGSANGGSSYPITTSTAYTLGQGNNEILRGNTYADGSPSNTVIQRIDGFGRETSTILNDIVQSATEYDEFGRVKSSLYMPGYGNIDYTYDNSPLNRLKSETFPDGSMKSYRHLIIGGCLGRETTDENGNISSSAYDVFGRLATTFDALGNQTTYSYTSFDAPLSISSLLETSYTYEYDNRNRLISKSSPDAGTNFLYYDFANRLKAVKKSNEEVVSYAYDHLGRNVGTSIKGGIPSSDETYSLSTVPGELITKTTFGENGIEKGKVVAMETALLLPGNEVGSMVLTEYGIDQYGRPESANENYSIEGSSFEDESILTYNDRSNLKKSTLSHSAGTNNTVFEQMMAFDNFDRLLNIKSKVDDQTSDGLISGAMDIVMNYNDAGQLIQRDLMNSTLGGVYQEVIGYNGRGWLTSINSPEGRSSDAPICQEPNGDIYYENQVEGNVSIADFFNLLLDGTDVDVDGIDCDDSSVPFEPCVELIGVFSNELIIENINDGGFDREDFANQYGIPCPFSDVPDCSVEERTANFTGTSVELLTLSVVLENEESFDVAFTEPYDLSQVLHTPNSPGVEDITLAYPELNTLRSDIYASFEENSAHVESIDFFIEEGTCLDVECENRSRASLSILIKSEAKTLILVYDYGFQYTVDGETINSKAPYKDFFNENGASSMEIPCREEECVEDLEVSQYYVEFFNPMDKVCFGEDFVNEVGVPCLNSTGECSIAERVDNFDIYRGYINSIFIKVEGVKYKAELNYPYNITTALFADVDLEEVDENSEFTELYRLKTDLQEYLDMQSYYYEGVTIFVDRLNITQQDGTFQCGRQLPNISIRITNSSIEFDEVRATYFYWASVDGVLQKIKGRIRRDFVEFPFEVVQVECDTYSSDPPVTGGDTGGGIIIIDPRKRALGTDTNTGDGFFEPNRNLSGPVTSKVELFPNTLHLDDRDSLFILSQKACKETGAFEAKYYSDDVNANTPDNFRNSEYRIRELKIENLIVKELGATSIADFSLPRGPYSFTQCNRLGSVDCDSDSFLKLLEKNSDESNRLENDLRTLFSHNDMKYQTLEVKYSEDDVLSMKVKSSSWEFVATVYSATYEIGVMCSEVESDTLLISYETLKPRIHVGRSEFQDFPNEFNRSNIPVPLKLEKRSDSSPVKGESLNKMMIDCEDVFAPNCTAEEQIQQQSQIENIYENINQEYLDGLSYPQDLVAIVLCDGSVAYILASQLEEITAPYTEVGRIELSGPNHLISIRTGSGLNQLFGLALDYQPNGNVKQAQWRTTYHAPKQYTFSYDKLNRMKAARYTQLSDDYVSNLAAKDMFSVKAIEFDALGNIQQLTRFGATGCGEDFKVDRIDVLKYTYQTSTGEGVSILKSVQDMAELEEFKAQGFVPGEEGEDGSIPEYSFDGAGRMVADPNKGLTIEYNFLDLPSKITGPDGEVVFIYDALGNKRLQKSTNSARLFVGGMEFTLPESEDQFKLESVNTGDGRLVVAKKEDGKPTILPEYHHKDHLGNIRVAFMDRNDDGKIEMIGPTSEINQQKDYYPFGLAHKAEGLFHSGRDPENRYQFNGIERFEKMGIDIAPYRAYDPALGRWMRADPLAEFVPDWTPYRFGFNNPFSFSDPLGLMEEFSNGIPTVTVTATRTGPRMQPLDIEPVTSQSNSIFDNLPSVNVSKDQGFSLALNPNSIFSAPANTERAQVSGTGSLISVLGSTVAFGVADRTVRTLEPLAQSLNRNNTFLIEMEQSLAKVPPSHVNVARVYQREIPIMRAQVKRNSVRYTAKSKSIKGLNRFGTLLGVFNYATIIGDYQLAKNSGSYGLALEFNLGLELTVNTYGILGGLQGAAFVVGWETGRGISQTHAYQNWGFRQRYRDFISGKNKFEL